MNVERQHQYPTMAILVLLSTIFLRGEPPSSQTERVVEAQKFVLKDSQGRIRAELSTERDQAPKLWLFDESNHRRAEFSLLADGTPGVRLLDKNQKIRAALQLLDGKAALNLRDSESHHRAELVVTASGHPYLQLRDKDGKTFWISPEISTGTPAR
jgi:hypothetical protein